MLFALTSIVSAYNVTYTMQSFVTSPNSNVTVPSIFSGNNCDVSMFLRATAGISPAQTYTLSSTYFSPDFSLLGTAPKTRSTNITCQLQNAGALVTSTSLNDFYEATTRTEYTADTMKTWLEVTYDCEPDSDDVFRYQGTSLNDSYGNHPFGYAEIFGQCCAQSPAQCTNDLTGDENAVIDYLETSNYFTDCADDLRQDTNPITSSACGAGAIQSDMDMNLWTTVPFNSETSGLVNISYSARTFSSAFGPPQTNNQYYIWDTVTNTTQNLGTSFPLSVQLNLFPNRDYWLFIGTRYFVDDNNWGNNDNFLFHNSSDYTINISACETDFLCGEFSTCQDGVQTRVCVDQSDCNAPNIIEERSCFDTPTFDLTLGFEEFNLIQDGVYLCQKQFWLITCLLDLQTIDALYPVNWTIISELDNVGIERNNYVKVSAETASVGSRSLKMWYIPPKLEEPVNDGAGGTVCGNASSGSFPEVTHPYNGSLFISQNVTFDNPFAQVRYDVRRCNEPVLQYDLSAFGCGELCYASSCNDTPSGRYGVRISRLEEQEIISFPSFSFSDDSGNNETENVTDGDIETFSDFSSNAPGATVNSTENIFFNGTFINFTLNVTGGALELCINDGATELTRVSIPSATTLFNFALTLGNISSPTNEINLEQCAPPARTVEMRLFLIRNEVMEMEGQIVFDYVGFAPATWDEGQIIHDLSNVNLETGINYSISLAVNPENQFDPLTHCVYMDNFRVTFTEIALPECVSECISGSIDRRIASLSNGVCTFITQINSPDCIALQSERDEVENILLGLGGGDITDNSTCIDSDNDGISDDLYIFDAIIGSSEIIIDSAACLLIINQTLEESKITEPLESAEEWLDWILFLASPLFIFFFITIAISGAVGALVKAWEAFGITFAFMLLIGMLITVPGGTAPVIPVWVGIAIISVISLLIAKELRTAGFGSGGG